MQNKDQFIDYPVKIIRLDEFDEETGSDPIDRPFMPATHDYNGQHRLTELVKETGFITADIPEHAETLLPGGNAFVDVYYPKLNETLPIAIPHNLNDLAYRQGGRERFNFYLAVGVRRAGEDIFTAKNIKNKNKQSRKRRYQKNALTDPSFRCAEVRIPPLRPIELPEEILHKIAQNIKAGKKSRTKKRKKRKENTKGKREKKCKKNTKGKREKKCKGNTKGKRKN